VPLPGIWTHSSPSSAVVVVGLVLVIAVVVVVVAVILVLIVVVAVMPCKFRQLDKQTEGVCSSLTTLSTSFTSLGT